MLQTRFYRLALLIPLLLPAAVWAVLVGLEALNISVQAPEWLTFTIMTLVFGGLLYGVPYLLCAAVVWRVSAGWGAQQFQRLLLWLPLCFAASGAGIVLVYNLTISHDPDWAGYVAQTLLLGLCVGYGQAALIGLAAWLGTRGRWLVEVAPQSRSDGSVA